MSKYKNTNSPAPRFISSNPTGNDLFQGKPQERVAKSISELIRLNRTERRLIGIDGRWGSGKSNLIKLVATQLNATHHFFIYDAWGHQEDLHRRSFLEELTENLCSNNLLANKDHWTSKIKLLLSRQRETATKTIPKLSKGVIFTLLVIVSTPIASSIGSMYEGSWLAPLITSIPFLVGVMLYIFVSFKLGKPYPLHELYALYKEQEISNETHVIISEKEPSVRQFQNWMKELSLELDSKMLVIVFDNMDRLPSEKVRQLWSSIHTFFSEEIYEKIWVLVPFDKAHLKGVFESKNDNAAELFIEKTFPVIYKVSPPVITDWRGLFKDKFEEAFGQTENIEFNLAIKLFDALEDAITPRAIISFINDMVAIRLVAQENIPLRYIAAYVLTKEKILKNPAQEILSKEHLGPAARLFSQDDKLSDHMAALVYNVPLALGSQVALTKEIQSALSENDFPRLNALTGHNHFADMLEQVVASTYLDTENAANTLSQLFEESASLSIDVEQIARIWDDLCGIELQGSKSNQRISAGQKLILANVSEEKRQKLALHLINGMRAETSFDGRKYYYAMETLENLLQEIESNVDFGQMIRPIKVSPEVFINYLDVARKEYERYKVICNEAEIVEYIIPKIPSNLVGWS